MTHTEEPAVGLSRVSSGAIQAPRVFSLDHPLDDFVVQAVSSIHFIGLYGCNSKPRLAEERNPEFL